jgi:hypothetical protein
MRFAANSKNGFWETQQFRAMLLLKRVRQFVLYRHSTPKTLLFVVGCQRSGTTLLRHIFRYDLDTVTYYENSDLSRGDPARIRLDPLPDVKRRMLANRAPLVVAKPLVESQNLDLLLGMHPDARGIWMFRRFEDVVHSSVRFFKGGTGFRDLAPILAGDQTNWRVEKMGEADLQTIKDLFSEEIGPHDAAALFWFARNSLFFSRGFHEDPRVRLCFYDDLVSRPGETMRELYRHIGRPYPGDRILRDVSRDFKGKGRELPLRAPIREVCDRLLERMLALPRAGA